MTTFNISDPRDVAAYSVPELAKEYGASEEAVWDAIRCELDLKAA